MKDDSLLGAVAVGHRDDVVAEGCVEVLVSFPPIVMSVAQAEALRSGSVLELGGCLAGLDLHVQAGGRTLAIGHLVVLVEDRAGVILSNLHRVG